MSHSKIVISYPSKKDKQNFLKSLSSGSEVDVSISLISDTPSLSSGKCKTSQKLNSIGLKNTNAAESTDKVEVN